LGLAERILAVKSGRSGIPEDIYGGFVRSLFNDPGILLIGGFLHCLMGVLTWLSSGKIIYLFLALGLLLAGAYRYYGIRKGQRDGDFRDYRSAKRWENY
jgi:hypothetical protein